MTTIQRLSTYLILASKRTRPTFALTLLLGMSLSLTLFTGCLDEDNPVDGNGTNSSLGPEVGTTFTYAIEYDDFVSTFDLSGTETWTLISYLPTFKGKNNVARFSVVSENDFGSSTRDEYYKYEANGDVSVPIQAGGGGNGEVAFDRWAVLPYGSMGEERYSYDSVINDALQTIDAHSSGTATYQGSGTETVLGTTYTLHYLDLEGSTEVSWNHAVNPFTRYTAGTTGTATYSPDLGVHTGWSYEIRGRILNSGVETSTLAVYDQYLISYTAPD